MSRSVIKGILQEWSIRWLYWTAQTDQNSHLAEVGALVTDDYLVKGRIVPDVP